MSLQSVSRDPLWSLGIVTFNITVLLRVLTMNSSCSGMGLAYKTCFSYCCCSVIKSCPTLRDPHGLQHTRLPYPSQSPRACSNSYPFSRWYHPTVSSFVTPSPALNLSQHQGLFQWVGSSHQVATVLVLQLQHQSFQWIFRVDVRTG